jgi:hypothetical protein
MVDQEEVVVAALPWVEAGPLLEVVVAHQLAAAIPTLVVTIRMQAVGIRMQVEGAQAPVVEVRPAVARGKATSRT